MNHQNNLDARTWVKNYADYLYQYAFKRVQDEELARELVQETFLAGLEKLPTFEQRSSVLTWLTAILRHKIVDEYRKKAQHTYSTEDSGQSGNEAVDFFEESGFWKKQYQPQPVGMEMEADGLLNKKEFENILMRCLKKLPALWMSVFVLKHVDEEKTETICSKLKVTAANYWVIIHRAKLNLRDCLQKNWTGL